MTTCKGRGTACSGARMPGLFLLAAAALLVPACGTPDEDEPLITTLTSPVNGAGGVPRQPVVYVRFNRPLNPATVNGTNVVLLNSASAIIATFVSYVPCMNEVRVVPNAALTAGAIYQITLMPGLADTGGVNYGGGFFQFTISAALDDARPTFAGVTGSTPATTSIDLAWGAATDASGIVFDIFLSSTSGCYDFTAPFMAGLPGPLGVTVPGLVASTTYYFVVRARDAAGNVDLNESELTETTLP